MDHVLVALVLVNFIILALRIISLHPHSLSQTCFNFEQLVNRVDWKGFDIFLVFYLQREHIFFLKMFYEKRFLKVLLISQYHFQPS